MLVIGIGMVRGESSFTTYFELKRSKEILGKTVNNLEAENRDLSQEIDKIRKSKEYARKVLRDKYHVTDPDESIIFFAE